MMISLCSRLYSLDGLLTIRRPTANSSFDNLERRVTRQPTLDGSAFFYDGGFSEADRTIFFELDKEESTLEVKEILMDLLKYSSGVTLSVEDGVFLGVMRGIDLRAGRFSVRVLVKEKLSA
ncbi:MAG: hypothetical protein RPU42_11125 [Candidatus Sedimenticola sp. (ex Thyasira tokunagai)]